MSDKDRFGKAKADIEAKRKALEAELEQSMLDAKTPASMSTNEAIAQGIIGILPMLLGNAIAKKRGMAAGAKSGLAASQQYEKSVKEKGLLAQENAKAKAKALLSQISGVDKAGTSLDIAGVKADAAGDAADTRFERDKQIEDIRHQNIIQRKGIAPARSVEPEHSEIEAALIADIGNWTDEQTQVAASYPRVMRLAMQQQGQGARAKAGEEAHDRRVELMLKERQIEGLELRKDEKGQPRIPSSDEAKDVRKKYVAWKNLDSRFNQAIQIFGDPKATPAQKVAIIDRLVINMKEADGMGANFTQLEERLQKSGLPPIATIEPSRLKDFLVKEMNQQDPIGSLRTTQAIFRDEMDNSLGKYTFPKATQAQNTASEIQVGADGARWEIVRDASGKAIGKKRAR